MTVSLLLHDRIKASRELQAEARHQGDDVPPSVDVFPAVLTGEPTFGEYTFDRKRWVVGTLADDPEGRTGEAREINDAHGLPAGTVVQVINVGIGVAGVAIYRFITDHHTVMVDYPDDQPKPLDDKLIAGSASEALEHVADAQDWNKQWLSKFIDDTTLPANHRLLLSHDKPKEEAFALPTMTEVGFTFNEREEDYGDGDPEYPPPGGWPTVPASLLLIFQAHPRKFDARGHVLFPYQSGEPYEQDDVDTLSEELTITEGDGITFEWGPGGSLTIYAGAGADRFVAADPDDDAPGVLYHDDGNGDNIGKLRAASPLVVTMQTDAGGMRHAQVEIDWTLIPGWDPNYPQALYHDANGVVRWGGGEC